jgi:hypothetical protein
MGVKIKLACLLPQPSEVQLTNGRVGRELSFSNIN